jgi:hypothetical protein
LHAVSTLMVQSKTNIPFGLVQGRLWLARDDTRVLAQGTGLRISAGCSHQAAGRREK